MAIIDTHRAAYNRPNANIRCGSKDTLPSPTEVVTEKHHYTVKTSEKVRVFHTLSEVNEYLLLYPNSRVVKTTRKITTVTTHRRIK